MRVLNRIPTNCLKFSCRACNQACLVQRLCHGPDGAANQNASRVPRAGCRTLGLRYAPAALPPAWPPYLQRVADAAVFERPPPEYPPFPWSSSCPCGECM